MRYLKVTCDGCETTIETGGGWPEGWWAWQGRDLCGTCAKPVILDALSACADEEHLIPYRPDYRG